VFLTLVPQFGVSVNVSLKGSTCKSEPKTDPVTDVLKSHVIDELTHLNIALEGPDTTAVIIPPAISQVTIPNITVESPPTIVAIAIALQ
jgi:hypothetical protein